MDKPAHGGYPGTVRLAPRVVHLTPEIDLVDGKSTCVKCGLLMHQEENPTGGDSWYYRCQNGHDGWIGK